MFGDDLEDMQVKLLPVSTYNVYCFPVQAATLAFRGFRINPYASFMDRSMGSWTAMSPFDRLFNPWHNVEDVILKHREWLTYILCLADGGPQWSYSKSQLVSRTS